MCYHSLLYKIIQCLSFLPRCDLYSNCIKKNEEQKEANKVLGDIMNGLIDNVIKK